MAQWETRVERQDHRTYDASWLASYGRRGRRIAGNAAFHAGSSRQGQCQIRRRLVGRGAGLQFIINAVWIDLPLMTGVDFGRVIAIRMTLSVNGSGRPVTIFQFRGTVTLAGGRASAGASCSGAPAFCARASPQVPIARTNTASQMPCRIGPAPLTTIAAIYACRRLKASACRGFVTAQLAV